MIQRSLIMHKTLRALTVVAVVTMIKNKIELNIININTKNEPYIYICIQRTY